jgi:hypothetical protein
MKTAPLFHTARFAARLSNKIVPYGALQYLSMLQLSYSPLNYFFGFGLRLYVQKTWGENPTGITLQASNAAGRNRQNSFLISGNRQLDRRSQLDWPCALRFLGDLRFFWACCGRSWLTSIRRIRQHRRTVPVTYDAASPIDL